MKRPSTFSIILIVATIGFLGWLMGRNSAGQRAAGLELPPAATQERHDNDDMQANSHALQAHVAALQHEISVTSAKVDGLVASAQRPAEPQQVAVNDMDLGMTPPTETLAEARAASAKARRALLDDIEAKFQIEQVDLRWSSLASSAVLDAAKKHEGVVVSSAVCREKSCRVEVTEDGSHEGRAALADFLSALGPVLPNVVADHVVSADGKDTYILYMNQAGFDSP